MSLVLANILSPIMKTDNSMTFDKNPFDITFMKFNIYPSQTCYNEKSWLRCARDEICLLIHSHTSFATDKAVIFGQVWFY